MFWKPTDHLTPDNFNRLLDSHKDNLLRNGDFRAIHDTGTSNPGATVAHWTATGDVEAHTTDVRKIVLGPGGKITQNVADVFGGNWRGSALTLGLSALGGEGNLSVELGGDFSLIQTFTHIGGGILQSWSSSTPNAGVATLAVTVENAHATDDMEVFGAVLSTSPFGATELPDNATEGVRFAGVLNGSTLRHGEANIRLVPIRNIEVAVSGSNSASGTLDLSSMPTGLIVSGDEAMAFLTVSDVDGEGGKIAGVSGYITTTTLNYEICSSTGKTFGTSTVELTGLLAVMPSAGSSDQRAYPQA